MDMNKVKLIFSEKYNQFYKPIRVDEDVGAFYIQATKNRHDKSMTKEEIIHIEQNPDYEYIVMFNATITAEQHFLDVIANSKNVNAKLSELQYFKRNMLFDSDMAMQKLRELATSNIDSKSDEYADLQKIHNASLVLWQKINHKQNVIDNRSTYVNQDVPTEIRELALSKRLFIERSDDYCKKDKSKHPCNMNERLAMQAHYPCGFIIRDRGGVVLIGGAFALSLEDVISFVENYVPTEREKHYKILYQPPITAKKKKQLSMCYKVLQNHDLYYKNEHNIFFWVLDKNRNIVAGGKNGIGFKGLLRFCRRLKAESSKK